MASGRLLAAPAGPPAATAAVCGKAASGKPSFLVHRHTCATLHIKLIIWLHPSDVQTDTVVMHAGYAALCSLSTSDSVLHLVSENSLLSADLCASLCSACTAASVADAGLPPCGMASHKESNSLHSPLRQVSCCSHKMYKTSSVSCTTMLL